MPEAEETVGVRIQLRAVTYVHEFTEILWHIDRAYNAVYFFFDLVSDVEDAHRLWRRYWPGPDWPAVLPFFALPVRGQRKAVLSLPALADIRDIAKDVAGYVEPGDRLSLIACQIGSPGFLEFIGKLNPLEVIRQWVQDRHERRKDREYREHAENEKLHLGNQLLRNQVLKERIEMLRELGVPRTAIKQVINKLLVEPFVPVQKHLDSGEVTDIERIPVQGERDGRS
jgi:hypothetical protein